MTVKSCCEHIYLSTYHQARCEHIYLPINLSIIVSSNPIYVGWIKCILECNLCRTEFYKIGVLTPQEGEWQKHPMPVSKLTTLLP